IH
ncbi:membrane transport family protein, partial [Vibrio parahaemolyticus V-223/04]